MRHHLRRSGLVCGVIAVVTVLALPLGTGALPLLVALPAGQLIRRWVERRGRAREHAVRGS